VNGKVRYIGPGNICKQHGEPRSIWRNTKSEIEKLNDEGEPNIWEAHHPKQVGTGNPIIQQDELCRYTLTEDELAERFRQNELPIIPMK
jgi:hypothetical protein